MQGRGRPPKLTPELEDYIDSKKSKNHRLTAKDLKDDLYLFLYRAKKQQNPELQDSEIKRLVKEELPGESAITKHLSKPKETKPDLLDTPWSIGCCIEYGIPADFIPILVEYREFISYAINAKEYLTIRKARWMARLYPLLKGILEKEIPNNHKAHVLNLATIASEYTNREKSANERGRPFSYTNELDSFLFLESVRGLHTNNKLSLSNKIDFLCGEWEGEDIQ